MATEPPPSRSSPRALPSLPGFDVLGVLGQGGMGVVYRAEQHSPRRMVALKLLGAGATTPERLDAFRREAAFIARLEHPRIVPLYGFGEHLGQPYLVLRWLRGGSAADRLAQGPVDLAAGAAWVAETAAALDFAHQRGLVHRDVKPSNILLDEAGHAYLTDFGIAGTLADPDSGQAIGSAAYMSPEQGRGEAVDHRADLYALAVTLFELLTGQKPYTAETPLGVIVRHIHDPIPSARAINAAIPSAVDAVIQRGLAKAPADRQPSAREFATNLRAAIDQPSRPAGMPTQPVPIGAATVLEPPPPLVEPPVAASHPAPRRRPGPGLWLGVVFAAACLVGVIFLGGGAGLAALLAGGATSTPTRHASPTTAIGAATPFPWLLADGFSDSGSGFLTFSDEDGGVAYVDGVLRLMVLTNGVEWRSPSQRVNAMDVVVSVVVARHTGPDRGDFGVLCRWLDGDNYVALAVSRAGQAAIWKESAGVVAFLADWTTVPGATLGQGGQLTLSATCAGDTLRLESSGQVLAEAVDPAPAAGDVALLARLRQPGELVVDFDDLVVTTPE